MPSENSNVSPGENTISSFIFSWGDIHCCEFRKPGYFALRVLPLSTSEEPIWQKMTKPERRRVRGEEVRMINVRACVSDRGDIFDGPNAEDRVGSTLKERLDFVEKQEKFTQDYQGEAFRTYLAKRFADKRAEETLKNYMDQFLEAAALPEQLRWLGRMRRLFAVVYASAAQAIDYGVLPWSKKATLKAILACMTDAMDQLAANFSDAPDGGSERIKSDDALAAEFKRQSKVPNSCASSEMAKNRIRRQSG